MKKKNNYANETELKSLLIRAKNKALDVGDTKWSTRLNNWIALFVTTDSWSQTTRCIRFRKSLARHIVWLSERTIATEQDVTRLCTIINLMIDRILLKPQFAHYTYIDEFYSDAYYKIFKYITNFNHRKISEISGSYVNAFAYITQIINNSIIYVITANKKYQDRIKLEYNDQLVKFANDNTSIKLHSFRKDSDGFECTKGNVTRYYYNTDEFINSFADYLQTTDFNQVASLVVYIPEECLAYTADFKHPNVEFKILQ